jgi:sterol desaturase/sphingolipid hydroxylase (fatty acid hydroxylase superfamily)
MALPAAFQPTLPTIGLILAGMAVVASIETVIPLHARGRWNRDHLGPNLTLTFLTFATNIFLNAALLLALMWLESGGFGLLRLTTLPPLMTVVIAVLVLDLSFYVAHVAMHKVPAFWRFHSVHHSDPAVDVTTTIRQHPGESLIRYAFMAAFAIPLGPSIGAFAIYRVWSVLSGLLEHSNIRLPAWLDGPLSLVFTWPNTHKIHHSRDAQYTDTNYGNIVSWWDRLFSTFTPAKHGTNISYGLEGFDDRALQTTAGLLALPFRDAKEFGETAAAIPTEGRAAPSGSALPGHGAADFRPLLVKAEGARSAAPATETPRSEPPVEDISATV